MVAFLNNTIHMQIRFFLLFFIMDFHNVGKMLKYVIRN